MINTITQNPLKQEQNYLNLRRITLTITFIVICSIIGTLLFLSILSLFHFSWIAVALLLYYILKFLYLGASYRHFSYRMDEEGLYINQGVFWRKKIVVSRNRVQHTDVTQGPLERKYNLATLVVHTAGTRNASVMVAGILHEKAEEMRASLLFEEGNDGV